MGCVTALYDDCRTYQPIDIDGFFFTHRAPCGAWCGTKGPTDTLFRRTDAVCAAHATACSLQSRTPASGAAFSPGAVATNAGGIHGSLPGDPRQ